MNRNESRVERLERPAKGRYADLLQRYGGPEVLHEITDWLETVLVARRGLPREEVRIDLRREGLFERFTPVEVEEIRDCLFQLNERAAGNQKNSVPI